MTTQINYWNHLDLVNGMCMSKTKKKFDLCHNVSDRQESIASSFEFLLSTHVTIRRYFNFLVIAIVNLPTRKIIVVPHNKPINVLAGVILSNFEVFCVPMLF